jgi:hypothetical protein
MMIGCVSVGDTLSSEEILSSWETPDCEFHDSLSSMRGETG